MTGAQERSPDLNLGIIVMTHHGLKLGKEDMRGLRVSERGKGSVDLEPGSHYHIEPQEKQCLRRASVSTK